MKRFWSYILILCACLCICSMPLHAAKTWETLRQERFAEGRVVFRSAEVEICTLPGTIMINTNRPVQVKVFSILGQLVSSGNIPAGVSQLNLGAHGIFIVKVSDVTCKVAL